MLLISTDKTGGNREQYARSLRAIAGVRPWGDIIDVSGLPLVGHFMGGKPSASRRQRLRDTIESARVLRRKVAQAVEHVDELFLTALMHPDVLLLYGLLPGARKIYFPHGFDCVHATEIHVYARLFSEESQCPPSWRTALLERTKRLAFGMDAVIPSRIAIDEAYSFNLALPWASVNHDLGPQLNRESMRRLFSQLPEPIRTSHERLARQCQDRTMLLLLTPHDPDLGFSYQRQAEAVADLARRVVDIECSRSLLVKPHPRNSEQQVEAVMKRVSAALPETRTIVVREHHEYPVEIVLSPFPIRACASLGSTSLRTLKRIFGTTSYCAERAMLELFAAESEHTLRKVKVWIEDNRKDYVAV